MTKSKTKEREIRTEQLQEIDEEIRNLEHSPLYPYRKENGYSAVLGEGNLLADIMFVGEAPGLKEAKSGRPFVGPAGLMLDRLLNSIGLKREDVYITNVVKDRPPNNRKPSSKELVIYSPFLSRQIEIIQPSVIVALGQTAMEFLFAKFEISERDQKISQVHGKVFEAQAPYGTIHIVPLYHPAVTFYNLEYKDRLEKDFHVLKKLI